SPRPQSGKDAIGTAKAGATQRQVNCEVRVNAVSGSGTRGACVSAHACARASSPPRCGPIDH
ncbi:MAG: hypothetical protein ACLGIY_21215, partial [Betaproteobacteria bacterium]